MRLDHVASAVLCLRATVQPMDYPPLVEAFLLIEQPRQRLGHWITALAALDSPSAPPLAAIIAYYNPTCDQALLDLRYDELALGPTKLGFVVEVALLAEVGMIQPAELSDLERKRFLMERLTRCTLQVTYQRGAIGALTELVRKIKGERGAKSIPPATVSTKTPPPIPIAARGTAAPRGDTSDPVLLVAARGTRDDLVHTPPPLPRPPSEPPATTSRHVIARNTRLPTVEMEPEQAKRLITDTRVIDPISDLPMGPDATWRASSPSQLVEPYLPTIGAHPSNTIYARYLRSGRWVPIRVGALSLKGAALLAGALPRLHDHVDVAFSFNNHRALVRGAVGKLSSVREAETTGASTFSVQFELDTVARRQLTALLTAARAANVTIKPPPPRATRRFPVEWPLCLGTMRGAVKADALDVSTGGMFVQSVFPLALESTLNFSMVLDDVGGPIAGRAKVVRRSASPKQSRAGSRRLRPQRDRHERGRSHALARLPHTDRTTRRQARVDRCVADSARRASSGAGVGRLRRDWRHGSRRARAARECGLATGRCRVARCRLVAKRCIGVVGRELVLRA